MISLNQQEKDYLYILGFCYVQQQKYPRAEVVFSGLRQLFPDDLLAMKCLAYVLFAQNKTEAAELLFQQLSSRATPKQDKTWASFMRLMLKNQTSEVQDE